MTAQHGRQEQEAPDKCMACSTTDGDLNQHCMQSLYGDFLLLPYKILLRRLLSEDVIAKCYAFGKENIALLEENPGILNVTWFFNKAHFHLNEYVNK
jgi:hypothetical protein